MVRLQSDHLNLLYRTLVFLKYDRAQHVAVMFGRIAEMTLEEDVEFDEMRGQPPKEVLLDMERAKFFLAICEEMKDQLLYLQPGRPASPKSVEVECGALLNITWNGFVAKCEELRHQIEIASSTQSQGLKDELERSWLVSDGSCIEETFILTGSLPGQYPPVAQSRSCECRGQPVPLRHLSHPPLVHALSESVTGSP